MPSILPYVINAALYAALALILVRKLKSAPMANDDPHTWIRYALLIPIALHTWLLYRAIFSGPDMYMGVGNALSSIVWLSVLIYWLGSFVYRLEGLQAMVLPVAAAGALMPAVLPAAKPLLNTGMPYFRMHLVISILAYSLFTIASLHVLLMAVLERRLHAGSLPPMLRNLPPLLTMEQLLFRIIGAGFLLLTLSLGSGMLFSEEVFGQPLQLKHKTIFAILSWLIFGALLLGRWLRGWRGRIAMRWTLAGFLMLVLAYIGTKFVFEVILHR